MYHENCIFTNPLQDVSLHTEVFINCLFDGVIFSKAVLHGCKFIKCRFKGCRGNADLTKSDFLGCSFDELDWLVLLDKAVLTQCSFTNCRLYGSADAAFFRQTSFTDVEFGCLDFKGIRVEGSDFLGCTFRVEESYDEKDHYNE